MAYLGLLIGLLLYVLFDFNKFDGSLSDYVNSKENVITVLLNAVGGIGLILAWQSDPTALSFIGISEVTIVTGMVFGLTGHSLIQGIVKGLNRKSKTKLGINE